jgi:hypothetical protein
MTSVPTHILRDCATCGQEFTVNPKYREQKNCDKTCRDEYNRRRLGKTLDPEPSPDVWDGATRFNDMPQRASYRLVCSLCSHQEDRRLTKMELRRLGPCACSRCGARMWLEGVMETQATPTRYPRHVSGDNLDGPRRGWSQVA